MQSRNPSPAQTEARRCNSRKSTGPRSRRGKRRSSRNALQHGLYSDVHYFYRDAAMELGEDPRDFTRLYRGLLEARRPADPLEQVLVEDLAILIWKKARLERAESAVQVCNVRKHDLERRRQYIQVGRDVTSVPQAEVLEKGLRVMLDAPGKFEKVISLLGLLEDLTARNAFNDDMHNLLLALYGKEPTMRGVGLLNQFVKLRKMQPEGQEFANAKTVFQATQADETLDVLEEYDLFLHEHVENTRAARMAAMAPSHAQWAAIIRQQNALHRQLEKKIRLLDELQARRRKLGSPANLLAKLADLRKLLDPEGSGSPASTTPHPSSAEEGSPLDPTGVASRGLESGCLRQSPETGEERAADMPDGDTSAPPVDARNLENPQNRGNEAKNSLKTNEVAPTNCANQAHFGARKAPNEATKSAFRCNRWLPRRRAFRLRTSRVAWVPRMAMLRGPRMRRSVA